MDESYGDWLRQIAAREGGDVLHERLGSARHIDDAAHQRARDAIRRAKPVSLARPVVSTTNQHGREVFRLEVYGARSKGRDMGFGSDRIELECHGPLNTHIDALNHVSIDGHCYSGWPEDDLDGPSVTDLAQARIFTRGVYVDLAAQLGVDWISLDDRISGDDIDGAIANAGVTFERGDALLVDIGRDRFEAEGRDPLRSPRESRRGGLGRSAAEWIADHGVSLLGWDFADSQHPEEPWLPVHALIWALGLVLVDNCHFTELRREFASGDGPKAGALVVAPPQITGGTGALVNPLVIV